MSCHKRPQRNRNWGPNTLNNYTDVQKHYIIEFCKRECTTWVVAEEVGENKTPHLQFAFSLKNAKSFKGLRDQLPNGVHLEITLDVEAAFDYCGKPSKKGEVVAVHRSEEAPKRDPGRRTDLDKVYDAWKSRWTLDRFLDDRPSMCQIKLFERLCEHRNSVRDKPKEKHVIWLWGDSGKGKTTAAKALIGERPYYLVDGTDWKTYDGERILFFDDIRPQVTSCREMLRITDRDGYIANVKFSRVALKHDVVILTNIDHPRTYWNKYHPSEPADQWLRRITKIVKVESTEQAVEDAKEVLAFLDAEDPESDAEDAEDAAAAAGGEEEAKCETSN